MISHRPILEEIEIEQLMQQNVDPTNTSHVHLKVASHTNIYITYICLEVFHHVVDHIPKSKCCISSFRHVNHVYKTKMIKYV